VTVDANTSACDAAALARRQHVHHLPVMHGTTLAGLVCTCDLEGAPDQERVEGLMSTPVASISSDATLKDATALMNERDVGSVVLLAGGVPCGLVTRGDLLLADPALEDVLIKTRCECCGITRHLRTDEDGHTFCIYCFTPGDDAAKNHIGLDP
jgi:signal-transduction protein with cAMP-binding, CBS, and nucleotidyltransferase domain